MLILNALILPEVDNKMQQQEMTAYFHFRLELRLIYATYQQS